ncbi:DUF5680 domain-containing protein [Anaerocolumna xylanovorans]|nr:DUF5680 domain-containing protein [Anaerocolumna xylanovorans]
MNFQEKLIFLRNQLRLSQEELAEQIGISRQAVAKWESGRTLPDINNLIQLSNIFRISIDRLVKEEKGGCSMEFLTEEGKKKEDFLAFLLKAKKSTYAGYGEEGTPSRPSSHDLTLQDGKYLYLDTYLGGEKFAGEEGVWIEDKPVWVMNYAGRVLHENFSGDFLRKCLSEATKELPYRGPLLYKDGDYTYHCRVQGGMDWFQGMEEIFYMEIKVYECYFHGGDIL